MAWDLFSSMELDLENNSEANVVTSAKVEPVPLQKKEPIVVEQVAAAPVNTSIPNNESLTELIHNVVPTHQEEVREVEEVPNTDLQAVSDVLTVFDEESVEEVETERTEPYNVGEVVRYEVGDVVKIIFPTEEEDDEMYNYLHYYYPHLKGKKGRIVKVLPYKKLQYTVEFDIKHDDRVITIYHENLQVFSY